MIYLKSCTSWERTGTLSMYSRNYRSKMDPNVHPTVVNTSPVRKMIPVAMEVLKTRTLLIRGLSALLTLFPVMSCKFCQEIYIGEEGHLIRTCPGYRSGPKKWAHQWRRGGLEDVLVPVETFRVPKAVRPAVIRHEQRFDHDRVPALLELCRWAGAEVERSAPDPGGGPCPATVEEETEAMSSGTLKAWEEMRRAVERLLRVYPAKVCRYCSEVHVGPGPGHRARLCGMFKWEKWRGPHTWKRAEVDHLVPPRMVWSRRPHDPPVLLHKNRGFYGCAPAVVDLCTKGGAAAPSKYFSMMKIQGLSPARGEGSGPGCDESGGLSWTRGPF